MAETDTLIGTTLGPCRLDALIGRGGMGRVYKARHLALDRVVAVKLVDAAGADGAAREQILAEARSAAKLEDPRIVAIYEVGEAKGIPYIVMQWVDGESLEARVKRLRRLGAPEALEIVRETATALGAAHKAGLVHRDIKPGNILVDSHGAVKLADFGIARSAGVAAAAGEMVAGSFHFMPPEQAFGGPPDPRSDLYALGATWYFALTGEPPFPGSAMDALVRHRDEAPPDVRRLRPDVTERAAGLLLRLLAKKPEDRPADAQALLKEMLSIGMLLDTDTSGSPFKILPAAPREEGYAPAPPPPVPVGAAAVAAAAGPAPASMPVRRGTMMPPPPPPPAATAPLGSKTAFVAMLGAFGLIAFGWQWKRAGPEDWPAGAAVLALLPALLTYGDRTSVWRKVLGAAACLGSLACWGRHAFSGGASVPALETIILAALGACALLGSSYLAQWGTDRSEALWARVLGPAAALSLLASTLAWTVPEAQGWTAGLSERGLAWKDLIMASGAGWRWIGTLGLGAALGAAVHLKVQDAPKPKDRTLNWNK